MVYAHQHHITKGKIKFSVTSGKSSQQTVREKCNLCDAMHHTTMIAGESFHLSNTGFKIPAYTPFEYKFTSIQIVLAAGRAPPLSIFLLMS
jgi:hypothetical protein